MELIAFESQKNDLKFLGCSKDVFAELNKICKLKSSCEMKVTDLEDKTDNFCHPGLKMHLEVKYSCLESILSSNVKNIFCEILKCYDKNFKVIFVFLDFILKFI